MIKTGEGNQKSGFQLLKSDAFAWFQSLRFSALTAVILGIIVTAAFVLSPSISVFVQQKKEIKELRESVEIHKNTVNETEAEKLKWQDPVFIRAQARERLFYVMPGEIQLSVIADGVNIPEDKIVDVSDEIMVTKKNWLNDFAQSIVQSGLTTEDAGSFF